MNKKLIYIVIVLIVIIVSFISYYKIKNNYHVDNTNKSLQSNLKEQLNKERISKEIYPKILEVIRLDSTSSYIALYKLENGSLGYSQLIKGLNGKFKIERFGHKKEIEPALYEVINTNKGTFMLLYGENQNLKINEIWTTILVRETVYKYSTDVSNDEIFIKYKKISDDSNVQISGVKLTYSD